jgi:hypothetical protein
MKRLRLFGSRPRIREMRLSGFIVRQREGSSTVTVTAPDGASLDIEAHLSIGNVRQLIIKCGRPSAGKDGTA